MSIFDPGQSTVTKFPSQIAPSDIATRLLTIQILLSRLGQAPFNFNKQALQSLGQNLMAKLNQPGAFTAGPSKTKVKPGSPSTFQDLAELGGVVGLLLAGSQGKEAGPIGALGSGLGSLGSGLMGLLGPQATNLQPTYGIAANDPGLYGYGNGLDLNLGAYTDPGYGVSADSGLGDSFLNSLVTSY